MPSARGRAHSLVEGAFLAALGVVLVFAALFAPVIGPLLALAWPLPVAAAYVRHDVRTAVTVAVVAAVLLTLFQGPLVGVSVGVQMGALGLALGWGLFGRREALVTIGVGALAAAFVLLASFATSLLFFKENLLTQMVTEMGTVQGQVTKMLGSSASSASTAAVLQTFDLLRTLIPQLWPTLLLLSALGVSFIGYLVAAAVFRRLQVTVPPLPPFQAWRLPWPAVAGWAAGAAILQFHPAHDVLYVAGLNLSMLFTALFTLAGMALLYAVLRHFHAAKGLAAVLCVLAAINGLFSSLLLWGGLFDAMFDYRRFLQARAQPPEN
ncbi:MAG TPA: DUF2232 domain-containing protein [Bacillota bacterium]|nr:DUF2232 domain-containing protein [Bacillota bacterium]